MKWLAGLAIAAAVVIGGLFVVFKFVVQPRGVVKPGAPAPGQAAQATKPADPLAQQLGGAAALVGAVGGAYSAIFGTSGTASGLNL